MTLDREAFVAGYLAEVDDHVTASGKNLLALEGALARGEGHPRAARELYRALHTIKGLSAMVGVEPVVELAHAMEDALRRVEETGGRLAVSAVDALVQGLRAIEQRVRLFAERKPVPDAPAALLEELRARARLEVDGPPAAPAGVPPELAEKLTLAERDQVARGLVAGRTLVSLEFAPSAEQAAAGRNITWVRERAGEAGDVVRVFPISRAGAPTGLTFSLLLLHDGDPEALARLVGLPVTVLSRPAPPSPADDFDLVEGGRAQVVRVEVSRLDAALERLSALVVNRFRLLRALADLDEREARVLREIVNESGRQLRDLRAAIMRARMVSVAELLERVPLIVRGLARSTGKPVGLEIDAGRAEVDKAVGERIFPAVVHLVRNAVDHAIEPAEERRARGKPAEGRVHVACFERGNGQLELAVSDDGRGVDREAVARRAGKPVPESDGALLDLLATPGLSTAAQATTTSGRGLGVDIVRRIVEELGGELRLETRAGAGSTFTMRVPLSLTIIDAFSLSAAGQTYVVPVSIVEEIVELDAQRLVPAPFAGANGVTLGIVERRGEPVPVIRLDAVLGVERAGAAAGGKAIIVRRGAAPYAFVVDRVLGQQEVVVRPVDDPLVSVPGVAGATDLGDGRPTLVLDLSALSARVTRKETAA
jgi:two-component system chemotaxis sensor kinase CheA